MPRKISKYAKPLPYFIKYKYTYLKSFDMSKTKMNEHCWFIEEWEKKVKKKSKVNTSHCMYDTDIEFDENTYKQVVEIFKQLRKEYKKLKHEEHMARNYDLYKEFFEGYTREEVENSHYDWDGLYNKYKEQLDTLVPNKAELANYLVELVYNNKKGVGNSHNLLWKMAREGIMLNLKKNRVNNVLVPVESTDGTGYEYLGRYYKLTEYKGEI